MSLYTEYNFFKSDWNWFDKTTFRGAFKALQQCKAFLFYMGFEILNSIFYLSVYFSAKHLP